MPSTSITFTTDSTLFDLFVQAACASYGYRDTIADPANPGQIIPNPQTPQQFAQQKVIDYCVEVVRAYQTEVWLPSRLARQPLIASMRRWQSPPYR
jgi:hypothetical protein